MNAIHDPSNYTDFQGLAGLRRDARQDPEKALEGVARQFEAMFVQMMLKSMREASGGEGLFDSDQSKLYQEMYDKQIANELSGQGRGLGIADTLVRQLREGLPQTASEDEHQVNGAFPVPSRSAATFQIRSTQKADAALPEKPAEFDSPQTFIRHLWPQAQGAAEQLGVKPEVLLAQAALETGWGKHVIKHPDGSDSHNLFNIKADYRWDGEQVAKRTLEYRDGIAVREQAFFRSYDSFEQSFQDYVDFLKDNPRYQGALKQTHQPEAFVDALQEAGYATDPAYGQKVRHILDSGVLDESLAALKISSDGPLS